MNLKGLDVVATRIWLDKRIATRFPANVLAGFEDGVGGTYFNLTELQVGRNCQTSDNHMACCQPQLTELNICCYVTIMHLRSADKEQAELIT